jgi:ketosteroid isomerase-like protein
VVGCVLTKEQENLEIVTHMFEMVEQGNIPEALNTLADDLYWQSPVTRTGSIEMSWCKPRHNRGEVAEFFKELREKMKPEKFEFLNFVAQGDHVVVEGKNRGTVVSTGNEYEHDWVMIFELRDKKIIRYVHYYDTADLLKHFH